jgi:hypothetical protein
VRRGLRTRDGGRRGVLIWFGALGLVVAVALAGRWLDPPDPTPVTPTPAISLTQPAPGSHYRGTGLLPVTGRLTPSDGRVDISVFVGEQVIGSIEAMPDEHGDFAATVPIAPPVDGGPAMVEVRRVAADAPEVRVGITLEPALQLVLWSPQSRMIVEGETLTILGLARPPAVSVRMELALRDGTAVAALEAPLGASGSADAAPAPWDRFEMTLALPVEPEERCIRLHASALSRNGRVVFALEMPLSLAGAPPGTACF